MKRPIESDYTSLVAYTRALEEYCNGLAQSEQEPVGTVGSLFDENVILRRRLDRDLLVYTTPPTAQPEQEPVAKYIGEGFEGSLVQLYDDVKKGTDFYTTPPAAQRIWIGLTDEQFVEAARLAEAGNYLVAFQRIQQWIKEGNT
jgi:hypothetical protein